MANTINSQAQNAAAKPGRDITEFANFAKKVVRMPQQHNSYRSSYGRSYHSVSNNFTKDDIR